MRSPLKAFLIWFAVTLLVGMVAAGVLFGVGVIPNDNAFERGELMGQGIAIVALFLGALGAFWQHHKNASSDT